MVNKLLLLLTLIISTVSCEKVKDTIQGLKDFIIALDGQYFSIKKQYLNGMVDGVFTSVSTIVPQAICPLWYGSSKISDKTKGMATMASVLIGTYIGVRSLRMTPDEDFSVSIIETKGQDCLEENNQSPSSFKNISHALLNRSYMVGYGVSMISSWIVYVQLIEPFIKFITG